jgi:hypothetical protein
MRRALVLLCVLCGAASADRRSFTRTFEYGTAAEGQTMLALWFTETRQAWSASSPQLLAYALQIEHGLTERVDAAVYTVLAQTSATDPMLAEPLVLEEIRLQARYRFADRSEWPVDLQLHGEAAKQYSARSFDAQLRVVVARSLDKLTGAVNAWGIVRTGADVPDAPELAGGFAAAASYELHPKVDAGVEVFGTLESDPEIALGPVLSLAPASRLWLAVGAAYGVTDQTPEVAGRAILGIELP